MEQIVILKSSKYGILLKLNDAVSFEDLLKAIIQKFKESEKFFHGAGLALSFEGRNLSAEEEFAIIEAIEHETSNHIICIIEENEIRDELIKSKIDEHIKALDDMEHDAVTESKIPHAQIYYGSLLENETLQSDKDIVVIGDVHKGAFLKADGSIFVFGTIHGTAHAGTKKENETNARIYAFDMTDASISIGSLTYIEHEKKGFDSILKKKKTIPQIASVRGGMVVIDPVTISNHNPR